MLSFLYLVQIACVNSVYAQDTTHTRPVLKTATITTAACIVADAGLYFYNRTDLPPTASQIQGLSLSKVPRFERFATRNYNKGIATATDIGVGVILASRSLVLLDKRIDKYAFVIHYAEDLSITVLLAEAAKASAMRYRPYMYNPALSLDTKQTADGRESFYSLHTALASCATFYSDALLNAKLVPHNRRWLVWTGAAVLPALVGWGRVASGQHFVSDVATGYVVGAACGLGTYYFSRHTY